MFSANQTRLNRFEKTRNWLDFPTKLGSCGTACALIDFKLFADETLTGFPGYTMPHK